MKRILTVLLLALCTITLFSCGDSNNDDEMLADVVTDTGGTALPEDFTFPTSRDPYTWGSTYDSPWNIPVSVDAKLKPIGADVGGDLATPIGIYVDGADLSVSTSFPVKMLSWDNNGKTDSAEVYCNPLLSADGTWNNCGAFLCTDGVSIIEGQTTLLTAGGNPSFGGTCSYAFAPYNLKTTQGVTGSHGGSHLSCLGGTLRVGELTGACEIYHSIGGGLDAMNSYSKETGHVWPATSQDGYYNDGSAYQYGGPNVYVASGSLLVLKSDFDEMTLCTTSAGQKVARAMKRYGFYCKDDTYWSGHHQINVDVQDTESIAVIKSSGFQADWKNIFSHCYVVVNNSKTTPGGGKIGSARRMPYAPAFNDGTGAPPSGLSVKYVD